MAKDHKDVIIRVLAFFLVISFLLLIYFLIIGPSIKNKQISDYNTAYIQGQVAFVNSMLSQIQNQGFVNIPLNENQSVILVPYTPQQSN